MLSLLITFLPDEVWPLLQMVAGLLLIVGARRLAWRLLGLVFFVILVIPLLQPLLGELFASLPPEVQQGAVLILPAFLILSVLRFVLGRGIWEQVMGRLVYDLLRLPLMILVWLWRRGRSGG